MPTPLDRDMGRHDAQIDRLESDVAALVAEVHAIRTILDQANGGWRALVWVSGTAGAIASIITWVASKVHFTQ